jgi:dCMP deaminase
VIVLRKSKIDYYLTLAKNVAERSTCSRRKFGAILVKNDSIIATGYNGSARGTLNCGEDVPCLKDISGELPLVSYDTCPAVHAEQNAILQSDPDRRIGATMFLASSNSKTGDRPCHLCRRYIIQSGIGDIYFIDKNEKIQHEVVSQWIEAEDKWMLNIQKLHTGRDRPLTL